MIKANSKPSSSFLIITKLLNLFNFVVKNGLLFEIFMFYHRCSFHIPRISITSLKLMRDHNIRHNFFICRTKMFNTFTTSVYLHLQYQHSLKWSVEQLSRKFKYFMFFFLRWQSFFYLLSPSLSVQRLCYDLQPWDAKSVALTFQWK